MKKQKKAGNPVDAFADGQEADLPVSEAEHAHGKQPSEEMSGKQKGAEQAAKKDSDSSEEKTSDEASDAALEVLRDKLLRLHADFDNYRKRVARDHIDMVKRANADLVESLLPVLDHIGHAETMMGQQNDGSAAPYLEGFLMVKNELLKVLGEYGVKPIATAGVAFDANLHDALSVQHSDTAEAGAILFEVRGGYLLNGRVLRAAQVIVASEDSGSEVVEAELASETEASGE